MAISGILATQNHYNQRASGLWPTSVTPLVLPYWTTAINSSSNMVAKNIKMDSSGNVYVLSNYPASSNGAHLAKFDSTGTLLWQKGYAEGSKSTQPLGLEVDSSGNVYICGALERVLSPSDIELFLLKVNSSGTIQWQKSMQYTGVYDEGASVVVSGSNVTVCGVSRQSPWRITLQQWDTTTGTLQWSKMYYGGAGTLTGGKSISADSSGNLYVAAFSDAGGSGATDIVVIKCNSSGVLQWQNRLVGATGQATWIAVDSSSNVYISAYNNQSGTNDSITAKYNSSGTLQWQRKAYSAGSSELGRSIALDSSNNVYVGVAYSNFNILLKYNTSGTLQWQKKLATNSVYADSTPYIAVYGSFLYEICSTYDSTGSFQNTILTKLPTDGSISGTYSINSTTISGLTISWETSTILTDVSSTLTNTTLSLTEATSNLSETTPSITALSPAYTTSLTTIS